MRPHATQTSNRLDVRDALADKAGADSLLSPDEKFGLLLRFLRELSAQSLAGTAGQAGIEPKTLKSWETGAVQRISRDKLASLASVLKVDVDWLLTRKMEMRHLLDAK